MRIRLPIAFFPILLIAGAAHSAAAVNCRTVGAGAPLFCVNVYVVDGYLAIKGSGDIHPLPGKPFPPGKYTAQQEVEELNRFLSALFRKKHLYELMGGSAKSAPVAAATVSGNSMSEGLAALKRIWPDCPECDLSFINTRLKAILGNLKMTSDTPLTGMNAKDSEKSILSFDVEAPATDLGDSATLKIGFDRGEGTLDEIQGKIQSGAAVRSWVSKNYEGRFWVASDIQAHFSAYYQAIGLNPTVIVSLAGQNQPRSVTISESSRIGRITFPGTDSGSPDQNTDKLAYMLLRSDQWSTFHDMDLMRMAQGGQFALCLPQLTGGKCTDREHGDLPDGDDSQRSLDYLSAFWLADRTADLQALGYGIVAVNETPPLVDPAVTDVKRIPAIDLAVEKLAKDSSAAPSGQKPAAAAQPLDQPPPCKPDQQPPDCAPQTTADLPQPQEPASVHGAQEKPGARRALEPLQRQMTGAAASSIEPVEQGARLPQLKDWLVEYGVAIQYKPNEAVRVLASAQSQTLKLGPAILSASGQAGSDGAHTLGSGDVTVDWLWFDRIRRRLQFDLTGSSDVTSKRILGGAYTDERRTGGHAHVQLEMFRDRRGLEWNIFAEPDRETVSLTRSGVAAGGGNLSMLTLGTGILYSGWITPKPTRLALNTQTTVGIGSGAGQTTYNLFDVDGGMHQRISNTYLISADFAGRFQAASQTTPVFELPSLGGGSSVRGFQADDALGRKMWNLQSEIWTPIPFTLNATEASGVLWFLRQNVRAAAFFDAGGVYDTGLAASAGVTGQVVSSASGVRKGAGAGIRFVQGPIALKLDWAYGFGQGAFGEGHGRFYLEVSTNGTF